MLDITLETDMFKKDARKAHMTHEKALPEATRYTLNELAFQTMKRSKNDLKKHFTIRNAWTKKSVGANKVGSTKDIDRMESEAGSTLEYMREQEDGINKAASGKHGEPIPTNVASGEGWTAKRKKKILRKNYLNRLQVAKGLYNRARRKGKGDKQILSTMVAMAKKEKKKVVFWRTMRGKQGMFLIDGDRLPMIYDLTQQRVVSKPRHWLLEPRDETMKLLRKIYGRALSYNIRRYS